MRRSLTIGRWMVVVAVVAADLALVRLFLSTGEGLAGLLPTGLSASVAFVGAVIGRRSARAFGIGFLASLILILAGGLALIFTRPVVAYHLFLGYVNGVLRAVHAALGPVFPAWGSARGIPLSILATIEAAVGLPVIALACLGGIVVLLLSRRMTRSQAELTSVSPP